MNAILQEQFQRVEDALSALIDSISTYTPSPSTAEALIEVDDELAKRLDQLATHQNNHATLTRLRETSASLSDQLADALTLLATTREELLSTPATVFPDEGHGEVPYDELLAYAKRISKFTVPPTRRAPRPVSPTKPSTSSARSIEVDPDVSVVSGDEAVVQRRPSRVDQENVNGTTDPPGESMDPNDRGPPHAGVTSISSAAVGAQSLDSVASLPFVPWPSEDVIRRGALASIQAIVDAGQDPSLLPDVHQDSTTTKPEPATDHDRDHPSLAARPNRGTESTLAAATDEAPPPPPLLPTQEEKPAVFSGLDLYDPDDE